MGLSQSPSTPDQPHGNTVEAALWTGVDESNTEMRASRRNRPRFAGLGGRGGGGTRYKGGGGGVQNTDEANAVDAGGMEQLDGGFLSRGT